MERKVKDFTRSECRKIAIGYATTADDLTASYFGMLYQTSPEVIYGVIRRAVVESMVGENVVRLISNKAGRNSSNHGGEGGRRKSTEKYQRLMVSGSTCTRTLSSTTRRTSTFSSTIKKDLSTY